MQTYKNLVTFTAEQRKQYENNQLREKETEAAVTYFSITKYLEDEEALKSYAKESPEVGVLTSEERKEVKKETREWNVCEWRESGSRKERKMYLQVYFFVLSTSGRDPKMAGALLSVYSSFLKE